jgi:hypothetical protein
MPCSARQNDGLWLNSDVSAMLPAGPHIPQHETFKPYVGFGIVLVRFD